MIAEIKLRARFLQLKIGLVEKVIFISLILLILITRKKIEKFGRI